ncbi:hypothetical protein AB0A63_31575 [Lentzea sp. NPDC042327]|uniref:hypothetical protein n=1 Tax=Lentzea sp. NPDC042327 TaxID=3154801 RepID=UPI0033CD28DA
MMANRRRTGSQPAPAMTCALCGRLGWDEWSKADQARRQRATELGRMISELAARRCNSKGLFHVQDPELVAAELRLPPRPWVPVPAPDAPAMNAYFEAMQAVVLKAIQQQGPGLRWPRNPVVASRYGIRRSLATNLRLWLQVKGVLRLDGDNYVTTIPSVPAQT